MATVYCPGVPGANPLISHVSSTVKYNHHHQTHGIALGEAKKVYKLKQTVQGMGAQQAPSHTVNCHYCLFKGTIALLWGMFLGSNKEMHFECSVLFLPLS